jgi:hypothetical protein
MPAKSKRDEEKWQKAKELAAGRGEAGNYAYIMGIYKKMDPDYFKEAGMGLGKEILRIASKHPKHREALLDIAREAGWLPGEMRDDTWSPGVAAPTTHTELDPEDGSQVPPPRDTYGEQLDEEGEPEPSIERIAGVEDSWATLARKVQGAFRGQD